MSYLITEIIILFLINAFMMYQELINHFNMKIHLQTPRLILRQWQDSDAAPFIQMCADPEVMRYFLNPLTEQQSRAFMQRIQSFIATHGWGLFAVELNLLAYISIWNTMILPRALKLAGNWPSNTGTTVMPPKVQKPYWIMLFVSYSWTTWFPLLPCSMLPRKKSCKKLV